MHADPERDAELRFTSRTWRGAALRQLAFGAIAAGATYVVGMLIGVTAA